MKPICRDRERTNLDLVDLAAVREDVLVESDHEIVSQIVPLCQDYLKFIHSLLDLWQLGLKHVIYLHHSVLGSEPRILPRLPDHVGLEAPVKTRLVSLCWHSLLN